MPSKRGGIYTRLGIDRPVGAKLEPQDQTLDGMSSKGNNVESYKVLVLRAALSGGENDQCRDGRKGSCDKLPDAEAKTERLPRVLCGG